MKLLCFQNHKIHSIAKKKKIQIEIFASILHLGKPTMKSTQFQLHVNVRKCRWIELSSSTSQVLLQ